MARALRYINIDKNRAEIERALNTLNLDIDFDDDLEIEEDGEIVEDEDLEIGENDEKESKINNYTFYYECSGLFRGSLETRSTAITNLILELDRLSWILFQKNKTAGANCIDVFSPKIARIFDMTNTLTNNIKFNSNKNYSDKNSFLIGNLNNSYNVFMPKTIKRIVLNEKTKSKNNYDCSESFILDKSNQIELYNSDMPDERFIIILENLEQ